MGSRLMLGSGSAPLLNRLFHCIPMERRANTCEKPSPHRNTSSSVIGKWCALRAMSIFFLVVLGCLFYFIFLNFGLVFFCCREPGSQQRLVSARLPGLWTADATVAELWDWLTEVPHRASCEVQECIVLRSDIFWWLPDKIDVWHFFLGKTHLDVSKLICRTSCH